MSKEPTQKRRLALNAVKPIVKDAPSVPGVGGAPTNPSATSTAQRQYLSLRNFAMFTKRVKPLPPDANASASPCVLYQFKEYVEFRCSRCRRDGIFDDSVAVDEKSGAISCVRCYSRSVRPKQYKPTRVVPFPSLLSWLNYKPAQVDTNISTDVMARKAEAVLPTGHRAQVEMITATSVDQLPVTPMNLEGAKLDDAARGLIESSSTDARARAALSLGSHHPCPRVFNHPCAHGATCFFKDAPADTCLEYLMGICDDAKACGFTHQPVFNLPPATKLPEHSGAARDDWIKSRQNSMNQAEWQMWNQPGVLELVQRRCPAVTESGFVEDTIGSSATAAETEAAPLTFNLAALRGAMKNVRQE